MPRCRQNDYQASHDTDLAYCPGCFDEILDKLEEHVSRTYAEAHHVYIGRTNYPERRLLEHYAGRVKAKGERTWAPCVSVSCRLRRVHSPAQEPHHTTSGARQARTRWVDIRMSSNSA
jgi:hypothetical protein